MGTMTWKPDKIVWISDPITLKENGNVLKSGLFVQFSNGRNKMAAKAIQNLDKIVCYWNHDLKTGPFKIWALFHHLNTRLVWFSEVHCNPVLDWWTSTVSLLQFCAWYYFKTLRSYLEVFFYFCFALVIKFISSLNDWDQAFD
jgi:hypothetical protein